MSTVAGRKKSVASATGLQIDTPVANDTFLNKAANKSTSLYQQCAQLRSRLLRIHDFLPYFTLSAQAEARSSTDPVTQLWDCFALGAPLCFLHNLLPNVTPIKSVNTDPSTIDPADERAVKKAILHFVMAISHTDIAQETEQFRATQLLDRDSTEGFVKVVTCVTRLVDRLPDDVFVELPPSSPPLTSAHASTDSLTQSEAPPVPASINVRETARNNVIREMVETERKYVQDLEHMQKYASALASSGAIDQDTIHIMFPGLNKLLDFQRRFLIKLESCMEMPWHDQRWGYHFTDNEEEFAVYEPYCANYTVAMELVLSVEQSLSLVTLIDPRSELPAFLIKPVQRICKYPLLLESLVKAANGSEYPHFEELKAGAAAAKRIADRINEAQRQAENALTLKSLENRVEDWKGHHLANFGSLLLDDIFMVTKLDIDREYHVFLFEKILLCCKEAPPPTPGGSRKVGKSNSILKKQSTISSLPGGVGPPKKKNTPLLLKGRIFLNNVTHTLPANLNGSYSLQVWWRGDDDNEYFTLRCRTEEQLKQWEKEITKLISSIKATSRLPAERTVSSVASHVQANSTNPAPAGRQYPGGQSHLHDSRTFSSSSFSSHFPSQYPPSSNSRYPMAYSGFNFDDHRTISASVPEGTVLGAGPSGYPQDEMSEDDLEEYPPVTFDSGRGTPVASRRTAQSLLPERDAVPGYDRPRARTEDMNGPIMSRWRRNGQGVPPPPMPPPGALPARPTVSRFSSNASDISFASSGLPSRNSNLNTSNLKSKFSMTKLNSAYESNGRETPPVTNPPPTSRSRSASHSSAFQPPRGQIPPVPVQPWIERSQSSMGNHTSVPHSKRGSGSSQTTESSDDSLNASPITPYGSSESSLPGSTLRTARSQNFPHTNGVGMPQVHPPPFVKVKVHFYEDIFVIQVPKATDYSELVERVTKKIRLCGPRRDDGSLRFKYVDEDGDMVSLGSTEDVQMAFETLRPGNPVTLYVQ